MSEQKQDIYAFHNFQLDIGIGDRLLGDNKTRIWDADTGQELFRFKAAGVAFAPDGKTIAATSDKTVRLLRASAGKD